MGWGKRVRVREFGTRPCDSVGYGVCALARVRETRKHPGIVI